jgi:hypothetical protein
MLRRPAAREASENVADDDITDHITYGGGVA